MRVIQHPKGWHLRMEFLRWCTCAFGCPWHKQQRFLRLGCFIAGRDHATVYDAAELSWLACGGLKVDDSRWDIRDATEFLSNLFEESSGLIDLSCSQLGTALILCNWCSQPIDSRRHHGNDKEQWSVLGRLNQKNGCLSTASGSASPSNSNTHDPVGAMAQMFMTSPT